MKRILTSTLLIMLIAFVGCGQPAQLEAPADESEQPEYNPMVPLNEPEETDNDNTTLPDYEIKAKPAELTEDKIKEVATGSNVLHPPASLMDVNWISPGKVVVANFHSGAAAQFPLTIHNGGDEVALFLVSYRYPDNVEEGYDKPAEVVQDWVIIADTAPVLDPKETRDIAISLDMPDDAVAFSPRWEFWVSVIDATQKGMVRTELCCRWLVTMRED